MPHSPAHIGGGDGDGDGGGGVGGGGGGDDGGGDGERGTSPVVVPAMWSNFSGSLRMIEPK